MKTLLAFLAHPDDESFGPGGTLAKYAHDGVDVHIIIATDGAAGSIAEGHDAERDNLATVRAGELERAVKILGATLHHLNYRDSGMRGDPANEHPEAWINSDNEVVIPQAVGFIRQIKPNVILTHNEQGDYFHPDHIRCNDVVLKAIPLANDKTYGLELGDPHAPERVYVTAFAKTWIRILTFISRIRGQDPTKFGRNEDIDLTKLGYPRSAITTRVNILSAWDLKRDASAEHASQGGGGSRFRFIPTFLQKRLFNNEQFIRIIPASPDGLRETSFFTE